MQVNQEYPDYPQTPQTPANSPRVVMPPPPNQVPYTPESHSAYILYNQGYNAGFLYGYHAGTQKHRPVKPYKKKNNYRRPNSTGTTSLTESGQEYELLSSATIHNSPQ